MLGQALSLVAAIFTGLLKVCSTLKECSGIHSARGVLLEHRIRNPADVRSGHRISQEFDSRVHKWNLSRVYSREQSEKLILGAQNRTKDARYGCTIGR